MQHHNRTRAPLLFGASLLAALLLVGCTGVTDTSQKDTGATTKLDGRPPRPDGPMGPATCQGDIDCKKPGACPGDARKGCLCRRGPTAGPLLCIPACATLTDCPKNPMMPLVCSGGGICVPKPI